MPLESNRSPGEVVHVEIYAVPLTKRAEFRRRARKPIAHARAVTRAHGGSGPDFYRVDPQRSGGSVASLASFFTVRANEDLWIEITRYPSKQRRRIVMKALWRDADFVQSIERLEALNSTRIGAWAIANGVLQAI